MRNLLNALNHILISSYFSLVLVRCQPYINASLWPRWCGLAVVERVVHVSWCLGWFLGGIVLLSKVVVTVEFLNLRPIGRRVGGSVARDLIRGCVGHGGWLVAGASGFWWLRFEVGGFVCGHWSDGPGQGHWQMP